MTRNFFQKLFKRESQHQADTSLLFAFALLLILGLAFLSSASAVLSYQISGHAYYYLMEQLIPLAIGCLLFLLFYKIDYRIWKKFAFFALLISVGLLILVFIPGLSAVHSDAKSWILIFGRSFQPTELVKLTFLIYLATWLEAKKGELKQIASGTGPFIITLAIISILIMLQPDFGTLAIILSSAVAAFFVGGGNYKHLLLIFLMLVILAGSFIYSQAGYQEKRIRCYLDPSYDRQDDCYQVNQSLIAIGSGGIIGRGLGQSRQKFLYLPEVSGDAIFPIIAEEIGFIFTTAVILLYLFIFYRGWLIARDAPDIYGRALAIGIITWLAVQTFFNIGGMANLIPVTGVPLPFISHGGSSLMTSMAAIGLLLNISRYRTSSSKI